MSFEWTDARIAQLTEAWTSGLAASDVADRMGGGLTRSAIIGKANRLGLKQGHKVKASKARADVDQVARERREEERRLAYNAARRAATKARSTDRVAPPRPREISAASPTPIDPPLGGVAISDLKPHHCRWPVEVLGEPLRYCGKAKLEGVCVYCAEHARMAYRPKVLKAGADREPPAGQALKQTRSDRQAVSWQ